MSKTQEIIISGYYAGDLIEICVPVDSIYFGSQTEPSPQYQSIMNPDKKNLIENLEHMEIGFWEKLK
jgi:hypothetical protein